MNKIFTQALEWHLASDSAARQVKLVLLEISDENRTLKVKMTTVLVKVRLSRASDFRNFPTQGEKMLRSSGRGD